MNNLITQEKIENRIFVIRGKKVILDSVLSEFYGIPTKQLKRSVRRNLRRFPDDFMFELTPAENESLRYHFGTLKKGEHSKYLPFAFTEHGIAMLSSVLNSDRAVQINISIIRVFVRLRNLIDSNKEVAQKISQLERKYEHHDYQIQKLFDRTRDLPSLEDKRLKIRGFTK